MRWNLTVTAFAALLTVASHANASDNDLCLNRSSAATSAKIIQNDACTRLIQSKQFGGFDLARFYILRGNNLLTMGNLDAAIADANEIIDNIKPQQNQLASAHYIRGAAYFHKNEHARAIEDQSTAIQLSPATKNWGHVNIYLTRGKAYHAIGKYDLAIADFTEAAPLWNGNYYPYLERARSFEKKGELENALADARKSAEVAQTVRISDASIPELIARLEKAMTAAGTKLPPNAVPPASAKAADPAFAAAAPASDTAKAEAAAKSASVIAANPPTASTLAAAATTGKRVALVIGNSSYQTVAKLPNPTRDAAKVAETLRKAGFQSVTVLNDLGRDSLVSALRDFAKLADGADWAMVYYAGHGMEVAGANYLVPTDAVLKTDVDVSLEAVPLDLVINSAERASKLRLIVLDACRDNPFASQMKRTVATRSVARGLAQVEPRAGTLIAYAAKHGETALDGDDGNSPFASALIRNIQTPGLEVRRLFDHVRDDVMEATKDRQQPFSYGSVSGRQDFYFIAAK